MEGPKETAGTLPDELVIVWTSGDRNVALKMAFMYTLNAAEKKWWKTVNLIIWGPSAHLLAEDMTLRSKIGEMKQAEVKLFACRACAEQYDVVSTLSSLGVEVKYMGGPLTEFLKNPRCRVMTF